MYSAIDRTKCDVTCEAMPDLPWFVVKTKPRHEKKVAEHLQAKGYTSYLPMQQTLRQWSDRKKKISLPLIPSIVFVQDLEVDKTGIYFIPGFHSILKCEGKIARVRPIEIQNIRNLLTEAVTPKITSAQSFANGDIVEVISGPFKGYLAKAIEELNHYKILIEIKALNIGYSISIAKNRVSKLNP